MLKQMNLLRNLFEANKRESRNMDNCLYEERLEAESKLQESLAENKKREQNRQL